MKIYTRTGDHGDTGLFGGPRVSKDDVRIEAYGAVDELNSVLGLARAEALPPDMDVLVARVQSELFTLGAELATPNPQALGMPLVGAAHWGAMEAEIDRFDAQLAPLKQFILPGGTKAAALLHLARTVCRRAERRVVMLAGVAAPAIRSEPVIYLNRLSDWLFVLARAVNRQAQMPEVPWQKPA
jgi:cob(I)alamin adenosyltransferase